MSGKITFDPHIIILNSIIVGDNPELFDVNRMLLLRLRCEAAILISPRLFPCIWRKTWGYVII